MANNIAPLEVLRAAQEAGKIHRQLARVDCAAFASYVLRDAKTNRPIEMAPIHEAWHRLADDHDRLLIWSHIEAGKTSQLSIARVLWELGRNPNLSACVVSNTHKQAEKITGLLGQYITSSIDLVAVFPHLRPAEPWTSTQLTVERGVKSKDPSVQALGIHGNIAGARIELLILDDMLDIENTRTHALREDLWEWMPTLWGRLTANARVICVGTAFHPQDMLHKLARQPRWKAVRFPVVDATTGASRWAQVWPMGRIARKREELGPLEFARQMLCVARDDAEARFRQEWINLCLARGAGRPLMTRALTHLPAGCRTYTGVDLAVQRHAAADSSSLFTLLVYPDSSREVLCIETGKWGGQEIIDRIVDHHRRYHSVCIVENNAAQDFIVQFARNQFAVPIRPFTTGRNKAHPEFGVESIAAEMAGGKWVIPNVGGRCHPEVEAWISEMLYYDPTGHTGDRLMSSWFAREGVRLGSLRVETGHIDLTRR